MSQRADNERKVLKAIAELGAADYIAVARGAGIPYPYADQLCRYLLKGGYLQRNGRRYTLTKSGQEVVAKEGESKEPVAAGRGIAWERWLSGSE